MVCAKTSPMIEFDIGSARDCWWDLLSQLHYDFTRTLSNYILFAKLYLIRLVMTCKFVKTVKPVKKCTVYHKFNFLQLISLEKQANDS